MTKLELKIPQPGVTFYGNRRLTTVTILDIKVDDGVKEVFFETIEKIISFADKTEGLSLKAYALDALNRMDTKTDFEI